MHYTPQESDNGVFKITIEFEGYNNYNPTNINKTVNLISDTKITINTLNTTSYTDNIIISGKLTDNNEKEIINVNVCVNINNNIVNVTTDEHGCYSYNYTTSVIGVNNVTVTYEGNNSYLASNNKTTFQVNKSNTKITLNKISNSTIDDTITIKGKLTDKNNNPLSNAEIKIKINNDNKTSTTDKNGIFTYTHTTNTIGTNNITATYTGNNKYLASNEAKTTFNTTKRNIKIVLNNIPETIVGETVTISGTWTNSLGNKIINTWIQVILNGKTSSIKTDKNRASKTTTTRTVPSTNNITAAYAGNNIFNTDSASKTFKVKSKDTKITINKITSTAYGGTINIT